MKRFAIAFVGLFLLAEVAVALPSALTFTARRGEIFQVFLNGRLMNRTGSTHLRLDLVPPGVHNVEVRVLGRFYTFSQRARIAVPEGYESNFVVQLARRRGHVILHKVRVAPLAVIMAPVPVRPPAPYPRAPYPSAPPRAPEPARPREPELPRYRDPEPTAPDVCANLLSEEQLTRLFDHLDRQQPESRRVESVRMALRAGGVLTEDLRRMLEQLEREESRLELAKLGYDAVCDKQNFYKVFSLFTFDQHIRELEQHMQR